MHMRMVSNIDLRVRMDAKSGQIKNGNKSEIFSAPVDVQESAMKQQMRLMWA